MENPNMGLPKNVIEKDRELSRSANELMKLRWHWTLDSSNAKAIGFTEYAREVGRDEAGIRRDARAWEKYLDSQQKQDVRPGSPQTPDDFRELEKLSGERQKAAQAVARTTGKSVGNVAKHKKQDVDHVLNVARERAISKAERGKPTTVEHEIEEVAEWQEKARKSAAREKDERKSRATARFIEMEGDIGAAMQRLRKVLNVSAEAEFLSVEETELLTESLGKLRALLGLIDLRIAGETNIDWDSEAEKLIAKDRKGS